MHEWTDAAIADMEETQRKYDKFLSTCKICACCGEYIEEGCWLRSELTDGTILHFHTDCMWKVYREEEGEACDE